MQEDTDASVRKGNETKMQGRRVKSRSASALLRSCIVAFTLALAVAPGLSAQAPVPPPAPPPDSKNDQQKTKTLTLTGCVERGPIPNHYTIADELNGKYDVRGTDIKKYLGQRVQVAGSPASRRFTVKGGLWPTPNVAAQAGTMDPAKAAIAAQPGGGALGTGEVDLPTFRVKSVRALDGGCK